MKPDTSLSVDPATGATLTDVAKLRAALSICRRMSTMTDLAALQRLFTREAKELLQAERVSIFLLDRDACELWSAISQEGKIMRFDARLGIAGAVAIAGETINSADVYEHPLFYKEVDIETGYRTKSLLAVPLHGLDGAIVGVGEATNKRDGIFTDGDAEILATLAVHLATVIENSPIAAEIKSQKSASTDTPSAEFVSRFSTQKIVGMSHRIQSIVRLIDQIRPSSVDVLIEGASGTGKELIAKALHFNSPRANHPFVALNCAAMPDNLIETELFGIEKGVATGVDRHIGKFESAQGGTLFLDEVGDLSQAAQAKILRVLQERCVDRIGGRAPIPIDVRIIAATNRNLEVAMKERQFRDDLYFRLSVVRIQTPSLSHVPEDIPILASHFLQKHCTANRIELKQFDAAALQRMARYPWPGNTRQLENEIKRLVVSVRDKLIHADQLSLPMPSAAPEISADAIRASGKTLNAAIDDLEREMIVTTLNETCGNKLETAARLGLSRQGLLKKLKRLGIN